ncbi:MAG: hypothetical protein Q8858_17515 [Bacteroidota bacterium]|nr:hypothetical protein [Bacteroidota bacterium]
MTVYKQIQEKFWQNNFVLDLTPPERYFYVYLITNTMTTACGIYRFNLKLAVLETGLSSEVINNYLNNFKNSGKIIISDISGEIMLVNWLKHNSKMNKKIIGCINAELKDVKDKELLMRLYEICRARQIPVEELFNGVLVPSEVKEEENNIVQAVQEEPKRQEKETDETSRAEEKEVKQTPEVQLTVIKAGSTGKKKGKRKEKPIEELEVFENTEEDGWDQVPEGTVINAWSFSDSGAAVGGSG